MPLWERPSQETYLCGSARAPVLAAMPPKLQRLRVRPLTVAEQVAILAGVDAARVHTVRALAYEELLAALGGDCAAADAYAARLPVIYITRKP